MELDPVAQLLTVVNFYIYGMVKAEKKLSGKSTVFSRIACEAGLELWYKLIEDPGIPLEVKEHPYDSIEGYINTVIGTGLMTKEDFIIDREDKTMTVTLKSCVYSQSCSQWFEDDINEFSCMFNGYMLSAGKNSERKLMSRSKNEPGNCKCTFKIID